MTASMDLSSPDVERALEIVADAVELQGPELEAFLDKVCGEKSRLREEVLNFLQYDSPRSVLAEQQTGSMPDVSVQQVAGERYELGREIARGGILTHDNKAHLWNRYTGAHAGVHSPGEGTPLTVSFDGNWILSQIAEPGPFMLWNVASGEVKAQIPGSFERPRFSAISSRRCSVRRRRNLLSPPSRRTGCKFLPSLTIKVITSLRGGTVGRIGPAANSVAMAKHLTTAG